MSAYTKAVARELEGCEAVSTGICPGCMTCLDDYGPSARDVDPEDELSTEEQDELRFARFEEDWENCGGGSGDGFSWSSCDACGSRLGGNREPLHFIIPDKAGSCVGQPIQHGQACTDCVAYLANGDEPEDWR